MADVISESHDADIDTVGFFGFEICEEVLFIVEGEVLQRHPRRFGLGDEIVAQYAIGREVPNILVGFLVDEVERDSKTGLDSIHSEAMRARGHKVRGRGHHAPERKTNAVRPRSGFQKTDSVSHETGNTGYSDALCNQAFPSIFSD